MPLAALLLSALPGLLPAQGATTAAGDSSDADARAGRAVVAFTLPEPDLIPEGIAYDPVDGTFFVGSTWRRKIVAVDSQGRSRDFTSEAQDGLWGVVGLRVDPARRLLWAATSHAGAGMPMMNEPAGELGHAGLFAWRIPDGRLVSRFLLAASDGGHFLNDVVVTPDGAAYVTDSQGRSVFVARPEADSLEVFARLDSVAFPNGIDLSADGARLYVAVEGGLRRIELATGEVAPVTLAGGIVVAGIDGLYAHRGGLIAVQPWEEGRAVERYVLDPSGSRVVASCPVLAAHETLLQPTTGAVVGDDLFLVANSQLQLFRALREEGRAPHDGELRRPVVLRVALGSTGECPA
jgi:sugar lactone lactonase YvrE